MSKKKATQEPIDLATINPEDLANIFRDGIKTRFWQVLEAVLVRTKDAATHQLQHKQINTLDDTIALAKWNAIFKTADEILNTPRSFITSVEVQNKTQST